MEENAEVNLESDARAISNMPTNNGGTVALYPARADGNASSLASNPPINNLSIPGSATSAPSSFDVRLCSVEERLKKVEEKQVIIVSF